VGGGGEAGGKGASEEWVNDRSLLKSEGRTCPHRLRGWIADSEVGMYETPVKMHFLIL
jgi:hypothetical protein